MTETFAFDADIQHPRSYFISTLCSYRARETIGDMSAFGSMEIWQRVFPVLAVVILGLLGWMHYGQPPQAADEEEGVVASLFALAPATMEAVIAEAKPWPVAEKAVTEEGPVPQVRTQYIVVPTVTTRWLCCCC